MTIQRYFNNNRMKLQQFSNDTLTSIKRQSNEIWWLHINDTFINVQARNEQWVNDIITNLNTLYYKRHCNINNIRRETFILSHFAISAVLALSLSTITLIAEQDFHDAEPLLHMLHYRLYSLESVHYYGQNSGNFQNMGLSTLP